MNKEDIKIGQRWIHKYNDCCLVYDTAVIEIIAVYKGSISKPFRCKILQKMYSTNNSTVCQNINEEYNVSTIPI
jgi:hypothetical protein